MAKPENTEEETGGQSLHFQEDRVLSELETAVSRQNPDGKEVQGYEDQPKKRPCGSLIEDVMEIYENLALFDYQVNKDIKNFFNHKLIKKIQIMFHQTQITALICVKLMGT